jgi:hypothetical protein
MHSQELHCPFKTDVWQLRLHFFNASKYIYHVTICLLVWGNVPFKVLDTIMQTVEVGRCQASFCLHGLTLSCQQRIAFCHSQLIAHRIWFSLIKPKPSEAQPQPKCSLGHH